MQASFYRFVNKYDMVLFGMIIFLCIVGTIMLYSASTSVSLNATGNAAVFFRAHLIRVLLGLTVMAIMMNIEYRSLKTMAPYLMIGALGLLVLTKGIFWLKGIHTPSRWLYVGPFSVQTSDISRLSLIIFLAAIIDSRKGKMDDFYDSLVPALLPIIAVMVLIVIQPDFSTAIIIGFIATIILFVGGAKIIHLLATGSVGLAVAIPVMLMMPYRRARILSWLGDKDGLSDMSYQAAQSLISLGNGGILGRGLGNSLEKNMFLPEPHTDFIFAIIGEEIGFVGTTIILTLFLAIFYRGIMIATRSKDLFGILLAVGISFSFILYAFINAAVVTNIFPVTGLQMPMISYGGSGLIINFIGLGILLNISQNKSGRKNRQGWRTRLYG